MSTIAKCPTCGSTSSIKEKEGTTIYQAIQDEDALKKNRSTEKSYGEIQT